MKLALVADAFPPMRSSGAVQLRDLAKELGRQGHQLTVLIPATDQAENWKIETDGNVDVVRLKSPTTKDIGYARRALNEFLMPFAMAWNFRKSPLGSRAFDGVIWYSPSIFHGPLIQRLRKSSNCRSYLILRDIFPEWAVDMGIMGRGLPYRIFKRIADFQYSVADIIGVQTPGNIALLQRAAKTLPGRVEVLHNWLAPASNIGCSIKIADTALAGRTICVYAGNMGVAQGVDILLDAAAELRERADLGFVFVGRGSDVARLAASAKARKLDNVLFFDEIDPDEIAGLYAQCHVGLIALDPRHLTHNIPGKFLSYLQAGLPVLASVNPGNDLISVITDNRVGLATSAGSGHRLAEMAAELLDNPNENSGISERCMALAEKMFSAEAAVKQIVASLQSATRTG